MRRALPILALVSLALAACGGSSSSNTGASTAARTTASVAASTAHTTATAPTGASKSKTGGKPGAAENLIAAVRECVKNKGTKKCVLPGGGGPTQHIHLGPQVKTPTGSPSKGTASTQIKPPAIPPPGTSGSQTNATPGKDAFAKFAACLRANGVSVPGAAGNTGPEVKVAEAKCLSYLDGGA
jgi:hypothetical protein